MSVNNYEKEMLTYKGIKVIRLGSQKHDKVVEKVNYIIQIASTYCNNSIIMSIINFHLQNNQISLFSIYKLELQRKDIDQWTHYNLQSRKILLSVDQYLRLPLNNSVICTTSRKDFQKYKQRCYAFHASFLTLAHIPLMHFLLLCSCRNSIYHQGKKEPFVQASVKNP